MSRPAKYPEKLLGVAEIALLTGLCKQTVLAELNTAKSPLRKKASMIRGEWRVPVSGYNDWVESCRIP